MLPRALLVIALVSLACKEETPSAPDAGSIGADTAVAPMIADAAVDAPPADAVAERPAGEVAQSAACADSDRHGVCLEGDVPWRCCGDVGIQKICVNGAWQCPPRSVEEAQCCGTGPGCARFNYLEPRCDSFYPDAGFLPNDH
jgi:hypothetical protein